MSSSASAVLTALAVILVAVACTAAPNITITSDSPRPGDVIFVSFGPEGELLRASCSWNGRNYQFLPDDRGYSLTLPVSPDTRAGAHRATIYWKYTSGEMGKQSVPVEVQPRNFGVQHLRLSKTQAAKYSASETRRERLLIGAALDRVSSQRFWERDFLWPLQGRISTAYGLQRYVNGEFSYRHKGIDIGAPEGTPVRAASAGLVALADDCFLLHGQTIIVDHGQGVSTLYLHLSRILVSPGESVTRGQVIGEVGATGVATGPHLHFATYAYHVAVDPLFWLSR